MSITVNTNMQALKIQQNLSNATGKMNTAMQRMSSGFKINSAKDDAAGLAVSTRLETTVSSSKVASANAQIGSNLLDTSEGTLNTIESNLSRIRDLTEQASTGTYSSSDKAALATEVKQRLAQINSSATAATFNGISLFGDSSLAANGLNLQVGTDSTSASTLNIDSSIFKSAMVSQLGMFTTAGSGSSATVQMGDSSGTTNFLHDSAGKQIKTIDAAVDAIMGGGALLGATGDITAASGTAYNTNSFLDKVDTAMTNVTDRITKIGAYQNRLTSISDSLTVQQTNLTSANSTIKDADIAQESATFVQQQILQSASASLLTQANSAPQIALTLIRG